MMNVDELSDAERFVLSAIAYYEYKHESAMPEDIDTMRKYGDEYMALPEEEKRKMIRVLCARRNIILPTYEPSQSSNS